jgi:hypothetical protein
VLANLDNPNTWALVSEQRAELFKRVMPMALENLSIAQHHDTLRMPRFEVVAIGHRYVGFTLGIMFICSRQPHLPWM